MTLQLIPARLENAPADYRKMAEDHRKVNPASPEAAALEFVANDMEERIRQVRDASKTLTVPQFAQICRVNEATVRKWIYRGELEATQNEKSEWEIPASARHRRRDAHPSTKAG